jgi:hypothetical protein
MADVAGNFEAVDERSDHDNFRTGIYERDYDGLLIARCNQNGNYPHHAQAILNGLNGKRVSMDEITRLTADLDAKDKQIAELQATLLLTPMAERVAELPDFMAALSEWGCVDPNEQADAITKFLNSSAGLREYLEDQSKAGGRDGN